MLELSLVFAILAVILQFGDYAFYFRGIVKGETKPHFFTWIVWSIVMWITFAIQLENGAGVGSWGLGVAASASSIVACVAFLQKQIIYTRLDWISLFFAGISLVLWLIYDQPLLSLLLLIAIDFFAYIPTFRKAYSLPYSEPALAFCFASCKYIPTLFALESFNLLTALYPATLVFFNAVIVVFLLWRRSVIKKNV